MNGQHLLAWRADRSPLSSAFDSHTLLTSRWAVVPPLVIPLRFFRLVYYTVAAATLAAAACLPVLVPLSLRVLGFDPQLEHASTAASFHAYRATAPLRRGFGYGVLVLALGLVALSIAALILRCRRRTDLPWLVLMVTTIGGAVVAGLVLVSLLAPSGICC